MHLIGVAFYESDLDRLESMWSRNIFWEMMAISCKKIEFQTNRQHSSLYIETIEPASTSGPRTHHVPKCLWVWIQLRIQGFLKGGSNSTVARENFEATPTLGQNHAHFDRF